MRHSSVDPQKAVNKAIRTDSTMRRLRVSILGVYEVLGLDECLVYAFSTSEDPADANFLIRKETVVAYESGSSAYFIPIQDFKERVISQHQAAGTLPDLLNESVIKRKFLNKRKDQSKVLHKVLSNVSFDIDDQKGPATQKNSTKSIIIEQKPVH